MSYAAKGHSTLSGIFCSSVFSLALCSVVPAYAFANESTGENTGENTDNTSQKKDDATLIAETPKWEFDIDPNGVEAMYRFNPRTLVTAYAELEFDKLSYDGISIGIRAYHRFDRNFLIYGGFERFDDQNKFNIGAAYEDVKYTVNGGEVKFLERRFFGVETAFRSRTENTLKISYTYEHDFSNQASRLLGDFGNNVTREYGMFLEGRDQNWDVGGTVGFYKPVRFNFRDSTSYWHLGVVGEFTMEEGWSAKVVARKGRRIDGTVSFSQPRLGVR